MRGGSIIPLRVDGANNTKALREVDFELLVAPDADGTAEGRLFLDDGESVVQSGGVSEIGFTFDGKTLSANGTFEYETGLRVVNATIMGMEGQAGTRMGKGVVVDKPLSGPFSVSVE